MILDKNNEFCDATSLDTGGTGRALIGSQINLGGAGRNVGVGEQVYLVLRVDTTVTSAGSATVSFEFVSDAAAAIATDGSASVHFATAAIPKATLVAGYVIAVVALPQAPAYEQYLGIIQNVGTAALTAGKIDAFLTRDVDQFKTYADATN